MRVIFPKRTMGRYNLPTFCKKCKKKLRRSLTRVYFLNGFHDEQKTRADFEKELDAEAEKVIKRGVICRNCQ